MTPQEIYDMSIAQGNTPEFALMCAQRQPPGTKGTDRAFLEGRGCGQDIGRMPGFMQKRFHEEAKRAGTSIQNKVYISGLAKFPGDPFAYVDGVGDLKAKAKARGIGGHGIVDIIAPEKPPTYTPLADDLVQQEVLRTVAANPGKKLDLREVREAVIDKHAPAYTKKLAKEKSHG